MLGTALALSSVSLCIYAEPAKKTALAKHRHLAADDFATHDLTMPPQTSPEPWPLLMPLDPPKRRIRKTQLGKASYYANRLHGRRTASGHPYYQDAYTAAHRTLPLGTWVMVTNTRNQRSVVVQITDRGPFAGASRIIDLSQRSARDLEMLDSGIAPVRLDVVQEYVKPNKGIDT
jgi:rare lipoprotein A